MKPIRSAYVRRELEKMGLSPPVPRDRLVSRPKRAAIFDHSQPDESLAHMFVMKARKALRFGAPPDWFDVRDAFLAGYDAGKVCEQLCPSKRNTKASE